ncbi:MAG: hypothetical protein HFH62_04540 [Lachnospiraceae bacterium]|nr:hypothetical protein [Lachnospiraceae bacterium]
MSEKVLTDEEMDQLMEEAEREASDDWISGKMMEGEQREGEEPLDEKETMREAEELVKGNPEEQYICLLTREYEWDGKKIKTLDLSGLLDLRTVDLEYVDMVLTKMGHAPQNKYKDTTFQKHVAMRATKFPVEFFNMLAVRDMVMIGAKVYAFFLFG